MDTPSILDTAKYRHLVLNRLTDLQGFSIPAYDQVVISYYGITNNINTVQYKSAGTTVATITMLYSPQPPTVNDANLVSATLVV